MAKVIGINLDPDRRQTLWNCLISLREVRDDPEQEREAYYKQLAMYKRFLDKYIN